MKKFRILTIKNLITLFAIILFLFVLTSEIKGEESEIDLKSIMLNRLSFIGRVLVVEDSLDSADIIVVLLGSGEGRIIEAVDIYQQGYAPQIVMVEAEGGGSTFYKQSAIERGIPGDNVLILEAGAISTQEEASRIQDYIKNRGDINSVILVTSKSHSRRAKIIFSRTLGRGIDIISRPTTYESFNPEAWWHDEEETRQVLFEYLKLINVFFRLPKPLTNRMEDIVIRIIE